VKWGIDPITALDGIRTAHQGDTVGQVYEGNRVFPVIVILDPEPSPRRSSGGFAAPQRERRLRALATDC
jgi:hypothetical protein